MFYQKNMIKNNWKRYLVSSLLTFIAGFCLVFVNEIDNLSLEAVKDGALIGVLFVSVRAGVKALVEGFLFWYTNK